MSQTTAGLVNDGKTGSYAISYESSLPDANGKSVAQALMNVCDQDFATIEGWFAGTDFQFSRPVNVELHNAAGGASWNDPPNISLPFGYTPTVTVKAVTPPPESGIDFVRYLLASEVTEMFMASKDNGWFEPTSLVSGANEGSKGEGLSRFLGAQLKLERGFTARYLNFEVVPLWLSSPTRPNYVDNDPDDFSPGVITGCTTCFLYYLHDQLGYGITDIINAGAATLGGVYQKLTGRTDGWTSFINFINLHYPLGPTYVLTADNLFITGDNLFPVPNLRSLESTRVAAGGKVQAYLTLDEAVPADVAVSLASDNPAVVALPATFAIPAGTMDGLVDVQPELVVGPEQSVTVHASYAGQTVTAQVVVLPRPSILAGVVTDVASSPLAGAVVLIDELPLSSGEHMQLSTGNDGSYTTGPVPPGRYQIEVTAAGYVPAEATVTVQEGVPTTDAVFALQATLPFTIAGTASDGDRVPIAGAEVTLIQDESGHRSFAVTGGDGAYRLSQDPGIYTGDYTLMVTQPGYTQGEVVLTIPNGATITENFVLAALGSLTGLVTDGSRTPAAPVAGATVHAGATAVTSDAAGRYQAQVAPGPTAVSVSAEGFEVQAVTVTVGPGDVTNQDFVLVEASATLMGTVFDGNSGNPLHGARVIVAGARSGAPTQFDGSYTVPGIPAGSASVTVTAQGHVTEQSSVDFTAHESVSMNYYLASGHPDPHPPT